MSPTGRPEGEYRSAEHEGSPMNARCDSATLAARIYASFPVAQPAFARLLRLLDIEATDSVPTAAVTMGGRSRLLLNPQFVAEKCPADHDLVMLVLHELHHVALGHTRLFPRLTPAQNWAFDCVINAQLCRLYPEPHHTALFRRCYRADASPEALLRPPEGWRTPQERWLPGHAGEVHRALYDDTSVTYADLYRLLPTLCVVDGDGSGNSLSELPLLGDHAEAGERSDVAPDVLREMRNILAEWPMVERISGRDQGGEPESSRVGVARALREAAATLRRAILSVADIGTGFRGAVERRDEERDGMLPYALRPRRADFVRQALGVPVLLHPERVVAPGTVRRDVVHVYFDVSGSMDAALPALYATLASLSGLLHPRVHLFSTRIDDIDLRQLARGVRVTTGGTDIAPVTRHVLDQGVRRALFVTDGWVGAVPEEHARALRDRGVRFAVVVTADGVTDFAAALSAKAWRLPTLEASR